MPKYNSINNIEAKLFFEILHSKNFELLEPTEGEEGLEEVFSSIYNEYFIKSDNPQSKRYLELEQSIFFMEYKIQSIVMVLDFLMFNTTTKEIRETLLKSLIEIGVNINLENDFIEEVKNVLNIEIGVISNDLSFFKIEKQEMQKQNNNTSFDFFSSLVGLESIMERTLDDNMVLSKFIEYERICIKKSEMQRKAYQKHH